MIKLDNILEIMSENDMNTKMHIFYPYTYNDYSKRKKKNSHAIGYQNAIICYVISCSVSHMIAQYP